MKKRTKKMDPKLLSSETHEIAYMAKKMGVSRKLVREARKQAGRSRIAVKHFILGYMFNEAAPL